MFFASENLKSDKEIVLNAFLNCEYALFHASDKIKKDHEFIALAINRKKTKLLKSTSSNSNDKKTYMVYKSSDFYQYDFINIDFTATIIADLSMFTQEHSISSNEEMESIFCESPDINFDIAEYLDANRGKIIQSHFEIQCFENDSDNFEKHELSEHLNEFILKKRILNINSLPEFMIYDEFSIRFKDFDYNESHDGGLNDRWLFVESLEEAMESFANERK